MKEQQKVGKHSDPFQYPKRKQPLRPPRERPKPAWQTDDIPGAAGKFTTNYQKSIPQRPFRGRGGSRGVGGNRVGVGNRGGNLNRGRGMNRGVNRGGSGQGRGFQGHNQMLQRTGQGFQAGRGRMGQNMQIGGNNQGYNSQSQTFGGPMRGQRFNRGRGQGSQSWVRGPVQQPMGGSDFDLGLAQVEQLQGALLELENLVQGPGSYNKHYSNRGHNSNIRGQIQGGRGRPFRRGRPY